MSRVPDMVLERIAAGEIDASAVDLTPADLERLEALHTSNRAILAQYPPGAMAWRIRSRARPTPKARGALFVAPVVAMAAVAVLFVVPRPEGPPVVDPVVAEQGGIRLKGGETYLLVYKADGRSAEPLTNGDRVAPGDRLQVALVAPEGGQAVVVSIDGRGAVTLHHPRAETSAEVAAGGEHPLPSSFVLDDAPSFERFFAVSSGSPFPVDDVVEAARRLASDPSAAQTAPLPMGPGFSQSSTLLHKEAR